MWYIHDRHTGKWWQGINTPEAWGEFVTACGFADSVNALPVAASL